MSGKINIKDGVIKEPKRKSNKRTPWWVCIMAFFLGIVTTVGAVAVVGAVTPVKKMVSLFGGDPSKIFSESYQNKSILSFVMSVSNSSFDTLDDISQITPIVETFITETLNPILDENLHFTLVWDDLKGISFVSNDANELTIGQYIFDQIKSNVTLASFINDIDSLKGVFQHFFFHPQYDSDGNEIPGTINKNNPYSLKDYIDSDADFFNGIINKIKIKDVIDISSTDPLLSQVAEWSISDFTEENIKNLKIASLFSDEVVNGSVLLSAIKAKNWSINDLTDNTKVKSLKLKEVLDLSAAEHVVEVLGEYTLNELETLDLTHVLKVKDVFPSTTSPLLSSLENKYLYELEADDTLKSIKLEDVVSSADIAANKILDILCNSKHSTLGTLASDVNGLTIGEVIDLTGEDPDSIKYRVVSALGTYPFMDVADHVKDLTVADLFDTTAPDCNMILKSLSSYSLDELPNAVNNLTIGDCLPIDPSSPFYKPEILAIKINEADDFENAVKTNLELKDLVDIDPATSPAILVTLQNVKLSDIGNTVKGLTLGEVIGIDSSSPQILQSLQNVEVFGDVNNLESALTNLTLNQVFTSSECSDGVMKNLWNLTSYPNGSLPINEIPNEIQNIKLVKLLEDKIYDDPNTGKINGIWWFLLTESGETFDGTPGHVKYYDLGEGLNYTIDDMDKLVTNMTYHMSNEIINDLIEANIITVDSSLVANLNVPSVFLNNHSIGELTINQFLELILSNPLIFPTI